MIPYAMTMADILLPGGKKLETRILEPRANGFTFRVSRVAAAGLPPKGAECLLTLLRQTEKRYISLRAADISLEPLQAMPDDIPDTVTFLLRTNNEPFLAELSRLVMEYTSFIRMKLELSETELAQAYTGETGESVYSSDVRDWREKQAARPVEWREKLLPCEIAVHARVPEQYQSFLALDVKDFLTSYWEESSLSRHPISRERVTHIYFGDPFCEHLFPDEDTLYRLADKALSSSLTPVVCLPPMPERLLSRFERLLSFLAELAVEHGIRMETVINDIGTAILLRDMARKGLLRGDLLSLTAGILMDRQRKDPRASLLPGAGEPGPVHIPSDAPDPYRQYLQSLGIRRFSHEACGAPVPIQGTEDALHLPLYQINTSPFCTLYAACRYGDRGRQEPVASCRGYCRESAFIYPDSMRTIGLGNTLFGCSMTELDDAALLNRFLRAGIGRLVVRL